MEYLSPSDFLDRLQTLGLTITGQDTFCDFGSATVAIHNEFETEFKLSSGDSLHFTDPSFFMGVVAHTEASLKVKLFA